MIRPFILFGILAGSVAPALAHPGHLADAGAGHAHWLALLAVGGVLVIAGCVLIRRRRRARRPAASGV